MGLAGHTPGGTDGVRGGAGSGALGTGTGAGSGLRTGRETRPLGEGEGSQQSALSSGHVPGTALYAGDTDGCPPMGARQWVPAATFRRGCRRYSSTDDKCLQGGGCRRSLRRAGEESEDASRGK